MRIIQKMIHPLNSCNILTKFDRGHFVLHPLMVLVVNVKRIKGPYHDCSHQFLFLFQMTEFTMPCDRLFQRHQLFHHVRNSHFKLAFLVLMIHNM